MPVMFVFASRGYIQANSVMVTSLSLSNMSAAALVT